MIHPAREVGSGKGIGARILGSYELELRDIVEQICQRKYDRIAVIGAAEGYFAIGFALRCSEAQIHAFEAEKEIRDCLQENIRLNGVEDRVKVFGLCQLQDLKAALDGVDRPLVFIDVEGAELELLDPSAIPDLRRAEMLVEIHDFVSDKIGPALMERFRESHESKEIWSRDRGLGDLPPGVMRWFGRFFPGKAIQFMDEGRGTRMRWFHLLPKCR